MEVTLALTLTLRAPASGSLGRWVLPSDPRRVVEAAGLGVESQGDYPEALPTAREGSRRK